MRNMNCVNFPRLIDGKLYKYCAAAGGNGIKGRSAANCQGTNGQHKNRAAYKYKRTSPTIYYDYKECNPLYLPL